MDTVKSLTRCRRTISRTLLAALTPMLGLWVGAAAPVAAQEVEIETDARLEGFGDVHVPNDSTALMWLFFIFLTVVALSPLFKDAKRTHLD